MTKNNLKVVKTTKAQQAEGNEKNKALEAAMSQIIDNFGKGSVMKLGQRRAMDVESVSTGSLSLDVALGIGGLPKGRVVEVYGPESSGKTTLALQVLAEAQKAGGICAFIDAEHALDPIYAKKLGVDTEELLISQPDTGEQALEIADTLVKSGSISVIVIDSVAALTPRAEIEGEMGDHHVGLQSRLMSQALRKLTGSISSTNTMMIFINQIRMKIGVMFGSPETTSGGNAFPPDVVSGLPNITPIFILIWLIKIIIVFVLEIEPVSFLKAWLINLDWSPTWWSPISPSISALGVSAATESITITEIDPDLTKVSAISRACSPVSGCEINNSSVSTPSFFA